MNDTVVAILAGMFIGSALTIIGFFIGAWLLHRRKDDV